MAGAEEVVAGIERQKGVTYSGLVLNSKGYERLAAAGLDAVHFTLAATDEFSRATPTEASTSRRRVGADRDRAARERLDQCLV